MVGFFDRLNVAVAESKAGRYFRLDGSGHKNSRLGSKFTTEIRAGVTTFAAMVCILHFMNVSLLRIENLQSYIISVNAIILSATGGTCVCDSTPDDPICVVNADYNACKNEVRRDLVTATAALAALSSFLMGLLANLPVALAPGMGCEFFLYFIVSCLMTDCIWCSERLL